MKTIKKLSLNGLQKTYVLLNDSIQASILGGGDPLKIKGGTLVEKNGGVQYTGDDETTCFFSGVSLGNLALSGTAYQYNGTINIDEGWANGKDGVQFDINNFIHEYGHFLQEQEMGHFEYSFRVAIPSGTDIGLRNIYNLFGYKHSYSHMDLPFEKNATERGEEYYKRWMRKPAND